MGNIFWSTKEENNQTKNEGEDREKMNFKNIVFGMLGLLLIGAFMYGCINDEIDEYKIDKSNKEKALEYYEKAGPIYYNECIKDGGSRSFCEEYAVGKSADDLIKYSR